jgi:site-specific recombinase XerD
MPLKDNKIKINKTNVDNVAKERPDTEKMYWDYGDGSLKGFGIRIQPSGIASYVVQYRNQEGRTRRMVIGRVAVLTPEEARQKAKIKLAEATNGEDPSVARKKTRRGITVAQLCDLYLQEGIDHVKPSTIVGDRGRIESHIKKLLGNRMVSGLTVEDIERFQADVAAGKTKQPKKTTGRGNHAQGGRSAAARTLATLSIILSFACRRGVIKINPALSVRKYSYKKRTRFLSHEELKALGKAMTAAVNEMKNATAINAVKALLLTGCRRSEILKLPKAWVDHNSRCIRFGDTKTGAQIRPIGLSAIDLFKKQNERKRIDGKKTAWLFFSDRTDRHFVGLPKILASLCARAGLKDVCIHVLRHTFSAVAAELGYSELTIGGTIGHKNGSSTARYAHVPDSALLTAADRVSAHIAAALEGRDSGNVISANFLAPHLENKSELAI